MRLAIASDLSFRALLALSLSALATAAHTWSFENGKASISKRGDVGDVWSFSQSKPLTPALQLTAKQTLSLSFMVKETTVPKRPHQVFLLVSDGNGLETFFPFLMKGETGEAKIKIGHKDFPSHLLSADELSLSVVIGSFGMTPGVGTKIGAIQPMLDATGKALLEKQKVKDLGEGTIVYKSKPEIRHIFKPDPKNPPVILTLIFTAAVLASLLGLFFVWFPVLGANYNHIPPALKAAPIAHPVFYGSLMVLEGIFFLYYTKWNLFQTLGAVAVVGPVALFSGSRALREVRARREEGKR